MLGLWKICVTSLEHDLDFNRRQLEFMSVMSVTSTWNPLYRVMERGEIVFRRSPKILVTLPIIEKNLIEKRRSLFQKEDTLKIFVKFFDFILPNNVSYNVSYKKCQYFDEYE